jgi:DnaJ homolog subfamily C member 7
VSRLFPTATDWGPLEMVLNKLLNKSSRKHRLDATTHTNSPPSPEKRSPASPSSARNSQDRERRQNLSPTKSSNRTSKRVEKDSHPLNLPPDLRRLSALSAMSEQNHDSSAEPPQLSSPGTQSSTPTTPSSTYVNSPIHQDDRPPVPPHRVPTSPPPTSPSPMPNMAPINAESFKNAGNDFFKNKNYSKAIEEYSKGIFAALEAISSRF